ncbi:MAG: T9SS type A sorting domain-containing protein, partial [bacterium]
VANATGGEYIQTTVDSLWYYYQRIQQAYQNQYEIAYISSNPIPDGALRTVGVQVNYFGSSDEDSICYHAPWVSNFAPQIHLTPAVTDSLLPFPQPPGIPVTVPAWVTDDGTINVVMLRHRQLGSTTYNYGVMTHIQDSLYQFTFGSDQVQPPGVEFYLMAADRYDHTITLPAQNPNVYTFQIAVLDNEKPQITHTPVTTWITQMPLPINCEVTDASNSVERVQLHYRNFTEIFWTELEMNHQSGDTWTALLPGTALWELLDLEYQILGWDDQGTYQVHGTHFIDVGTHPLQVSLTPHNPPIQIPAVGGSFDFNTAITNSGTEPVSFQIWTMVTLPTGDQHGPILGPLNITLPVGGGIIKDRTQDVPAFADSGMYTYQGCVGLFPSQVWDSDSFTFEKLSTGEGSSVHDWMNRGEDFTAANATSIPSELSPSSFCLFPCAPNPFNPSTTIRFTLPQASMVKLEVFDVNGRAVGGGSTPALQWYTAGTHEIPFDGSNLPSGMYIYRLTAGDWQAAGKMVLLK